MKIRLPEVALILFVLFALAMLYHFGRSTDWNHISRSQADAQRQLQAAQLEIVVLKAELETVKLILESWQCKACELESEKLEASHGRTRTGTGKDSRTTE